MYIGSLLTWERPAELAQALEMAQSRHLSRMIEQLSGVLGKLQVTGAEKTACVKNIRERMGSLSEDGLIRILRAPETHFQLTRPFDKSRELIHFLDGAIRAEECRAGDETALLADAWTANGDTFFPVGASAANQNRKHEPCSTNGIYSAPLVADDTVVDMYSPYAYIDMNDVAANARIAPLGRSPETAARFIHRLQSTIAGIHATCLPAYELVARSIRVLVVLKDGDADDGYRTLSSRAYIGKATLVNAHIYKVTESRLADSIVHEAIHSFLYENEQKARWITNVNDSHADIQSPWTGKMLRLDSYLHACFVWYALAKFWQLPAVARNFPPTEVEYLASRALHGFKNGKMLEPIRRRESKIIRGIPEQIEWLHENL